MDVYWGVSPVLNTASQSYWERKNNVVFPPSFRPDLSWSIAFSHQVMEWAEQKDASVYLMPIRTNLEAYLEGVFGGAGRSHEEAAGR